jgi:hypothetical protein
MDLGWQDFVALGIVVAALAYLMRLGLSAYTRKQGSSCATACSKCARGTVSQGDEEDRQQIVSIGTLRTASAPSRSSPEIQTNVAEAESHPGAC